MEITPVQVVPRTEERGTELPSCKHPLCDRLCDCTLPCPSQPIQPVDRRLVKVLCPEFDLIQDGPAGPLQTTVTVAMTILGPLRTGEIIEGGQLSC